MTNFVVSHDTFVLSPSGTSAIAAKYSGKMEHIDFVTGKRKLLPITMCDSPIEVPSNPNASPHRRAILTPYLQFLDERHFLLVSDENQLVAHNLENDDSQVLAELEGKPSVFKVHRFAERIIVALENKVYVYSFEGQLLHTLTGCRSAVNDVGAFHRARKIVAVGDKKLHCWDLDAKKPKDMPLFTFPDKGAQLSVSECDKFISCTVLAPWYERQLFIIDTETSESVFQDDRERPKYRYSGGALFSSDKLYVVGLAEINPLSVTDWKELDATAELRFMRTADCVNGVLVAGNGEAIRVFEHGKHDFVSQGLENCAPVHTVTNIGDQIYSISQVDCLIRDRHGLGTHRLKFDEELQHGGYVHGVEECLFEDSVWLPCCGKAVVYDFKEQRTVSQTGWGWHLGASLRLSSNHLLLTHEDGRLSIYTDDGEKLNHSSGRTRKFQFAWQLNDEEVMLIAEEGYFRVALDRLHHSTGEQYPGKMENAYHSEDSGLVYLDMNYGHSRKLIATAGDLNSMDAPSWSFDLGNDGYLVGWLKKNESLLIATNGTVKRIDILTGQPSEIMGIEIPAYAKANCVWSDEKILMIGLSDGRILTSELTEGAKE